MRLRFVFSTWPLTNDGATRASEETELVIVSQRFSSKKISALVTYLATGLRRLFRAAGAPIDDREARADDMMD